MYLCTSFLNKKNTMGFFQTIKNKLGIGGVSVKLEVPGQVAKDSGAIEGKFTLTTKSDQEVVSYTVTFIEEYTTGRGDDKKTKEIELGRFDKTESFAMKSGDIKEISFVVPFSLVKSNNDELKEMGGALGALGKVSAFASNEKSEYFVEVEVDVKAAALDPSDKKAIRLI